MDNEITISEESPDHLITHWLGVLVGMGIRYKIDPESPLFRVMNENKLSMLDKLMESRANKNKPEFKNGYRVIHEAGDSDSISVTMRPNG